ncbi:MAG TPA: apolipoprotein N-acyltransferase [Alphaproteobacteria bacterium]|nr:apolipoprotein N-acyltransferase [Alphaproteobacteria bacterium]
MTDSQVRVFAGLRSWRGWILAGIAGALSALAMAPTFAVPILLVTVPILVLLMDCAKSWKRAFALGWWFGFGYMVVGLYWLRNAFLVDAKEFAWAIPFGTLGLPAGMALYMGAAMVLAWWLWRPGPWRIITFAAAWTAGELARGYLLTGFPWNLIGDAWSFSPVMAQSAAVYGSYGLSFVTMAIAASPAALVGRRLAGPRGWMPVILSVLALVIMGAGGAYRVLTAGFGTVPGVHLRIVQANIPQAQKWDVKKREDVLVKYMTMSDEDVSDGDVTIIWPESAIPYFIDQDIARRVLIGRLARPDGHVILGVPRYRREKDGKLDFWNSLEVLDDEGRTLDIYNKHHLVPFGEYLPLRWLLAPLGIAKLVEVGDGDFLAGSGVKTIDVPGLPPFSPLICYEAIFPGQVADESHHPAWLLNITNDAWFGDSNGPRQHFAMVRMRAIEEGVPVVRAAVTGISAIVDSYGRVRRELPLDVAGVIDGNLPQAIKGRTLFSIVGNWLALAMVVASLGIPLFIDKSRSRK